MADANAVARDQLRSFIERIERVEEEIATLNTDKSDIYKEARAVGFDVKVLRKVVAMRKLETHVREEQDAIFDMYWEALYGAPVHVHARENIEEFRRSDLGLNIHTKHENIRTSDGSPSVSSSLAARGAEESAASNSPETAIEVPAQDGGGTALGESHGDKSNAARPASVDAQPNGRGSAGEAEESVVTAGETATNSPEEAEERYPSAEREDSAAANAGGDHVDSIATRERETVTSNTGEGEESAALPAKPEVSYRPNCLHPENCASGTRDHCWSCRRAMQQSEVAA